jgi:hypothetical protein
MVGGEGDRVVCPDTVELETTSLRNGDDGAMDGGTSTTTVSGTVDILVFFEVEVSALLLIG